MNQGLHETIQRLSWAWGVLNISIKSAIDERIRKAFEKFGYTTRPGLEYLRFSRLRYSSTPDMPLSFFGSKCALAICYECEREWRGLHIHIFPDTDNTALDHLNSIIDRISGPTNKISLLDFNVSRLTWNHKMTALTTIIAFVTYLAIQSINISSSTFPLSSVFTGLCILIFIAAIVYIFLIMLLILARAIYAYKFIWGT